MNLKYVEPGQPLEVAFDLYPGQIFRGKVHSIWRANGGTISADRRDPQIPPAAFGHPTRPVPRRSSWTTRTSRSFPLAHMALSDQYLIMRCGLAPKRTIPRAGDSYAATLGAQR
jgi:hypothetical protein